MKPLHIANSPLTNTIYAGHVLKGNRWAAGKQEATVAALLAVAEHVVRHGQPVVLSAEEGDPLYRITVERLGA